ncbi:ABC transporter ATP-binding protein [Calothrix sp. PCC 7507]|uniref:ABC transporter ATP-binding protein n=1 Tax=Calothrix sp. PCC 7507 TaxID=99598 RepID=UPI00029EEBC1|nr:ABC transporter ATP-binding protein [Calothrix sp. PCC 7507]AFY35360.1 Xenobiotic-transporting ATPase [Calothrix sp. PCC 7507]
MNIIDFLRTIITYIAPYKKLAIFLIFGRIFEAIFQSAIGVSFKFIIDEAIIPQNYDLLILTIMLLGGGAIALTLITLLIDYFDARFSILIINQLRESLFRHIQVMSMDFFGKKSSGNIVNCFTADAEKVENGIVYGMTVIFFNSSNILFSSIYLFYLNWQLAILGTIGLIICAVAPTLIIRLATEVGYQLRQKEGEIASVVSENILAQSVIKNFALETKMADDFNVKLLELKQLYINAKFIGYLVQRIPKLTFILVQLLILGTGAAMAYWHLITVGTLVSNQILLMGLYSTIDNYSWGLPYLIDGAAGMRRIQDILQEKITTQDIPEAVELKHFNQEICFDNVSFKYSENRGGIENLSLKIRQGEFAVFVGASGAGKSTIVNLLTRFYQPNSGKILFDGVDLSQATMRSLRSQIGLVSQEVILFNCSVRENIRMGYLEASDAQVEAAAKAAEIHDFILTLPQGYDTTVGDRGGQLSGGQRQRIALARALVRNPAILILDEATSALDPVTEAEILATLEQIAKTRTVIVITHRLTQALRADVIFVLENGCLVNSGRHLDLIAEDGLYSTLWQVVSA